MDQSPTKRFAAQSTSHAIRIYAPSGRLLTRIAVPIMSAHATLLGLRGPRQRTAQGTIVQEDVRVSLFQDIDKSTGESLLKTTQRTRILRHLARFPPWVLAELPTELFGHDSSGAYH
jgi:hypothetical protein